MDYFKILKDSYEIALKRRYLWIFGIFAGGSALGGGWNMGAYNSESLSEKWSKSFNGSMTAGWEQIWANYWGVIVAAIGFLLLLSFLWLVFSLVCRGALLDSVRKIQEKKDNNFRLGFAFGWHKFWRILAVSLIIGFFVFFSIAILAVPVILFVLAKIYVLAVLYGLIVFLLDLIFWIYLGILQPYILRLAVLGDLGSWEAITHSYQFFLKNWKEIIIIYLLMMVVGIAIALGLLAVLIIAGGLLFLIGLAIYLASAIACWIYAGLAIFIFMVMLAILAGMINVFNSSVITLAYLELEKS